MYSPGLQTQIIDSYKTALLISVSRKTIRTNVDLKGKLYEQMPGPSLFQMLHVDSLQENQISLLSVTSPSLTTVRWPFFTSTAMTELN